LRRGVPRTLAHRSERLEGVARRVAVGSHRMLAQHAQRLAGLRRGLDAERLAARWRRHRTRLDGLAGRLPLAGRRRLERAEQRLAAHEARARALDPRRVLARGYSLTTDASGALVRDASKLVAGQRIHTRLARGSVLSRVEETRPEEDES
jgi:exodeoxyribonuclease VII large subunit